ncbi:30S ribosomal protein S6 [candidate division KSB1 bacterium]|nr:30S ribosomal protein S6 [candidate division KSB1 bacterium]NIR69917.1 30S ribosomal protein S6 [candidate division KSB1 bacterium]NIS25826.1 30S ribosomal protein S6 [candidate division KSB1 bacterium]NIT72701.1 30S ribosomal protein S6 [candidate division KSB1 bacterium]NIU26515.1 30S ribosomal protein S6 [candidate division KSB1 bacterium]
MPKYETTVVCDSFLKDEDKQNLVTKIENFIKNNGGEIHKIEDWGKKRLAYEIQRKQYGIYVYFLYSGPSALPDLLEREFRLEEPILRYLTVKFDPKMMEPEEVKPGGSEPKKSTGEDESEKSGDENDEDTAVDETEEAEVKE